MITVSLAGGLGNQLYQYAFGRALAEVYGRRLILDASRHPTGPIGHQRHLELLNFRLEPSVRVILSARPESKNLSQNSLRLAGKALRFGYQMLARRTRDLDARREELHVVPVGDAHAQKPRPFFHLFDGYWHSFEAFEVIRPLLAYELTPRSMTHFAQPKFIDASPGKARVSVHIRRTDNVFLGTELPLAYYEAAIAKAAVDIGDLHLFVFSDDPAWAAEHFRPDFEVTHLELDSQLGPVQTFSLMTQLDHHVLANSTLSWWGAWMCRNAQQRVFYPAFWYRAHDLSVTRRFPTNWVAVEPSSGLRAAT